MPLIKGRHKWSLWLRNHKPLKVPSYKEQRTIRTSLGMTLEQPFPRCPGKGSRYDLGRDPFMKKLEASGDFSHSGKRQSHLCDVCRCKRTAGWGTKHYGVGMCFWHDCAGARKLAKSMTIALQQGYPLDPVKYHSDRDYIEDVRKMAEAAHGRLSLGEELNVLRAHIQEIEKLYSETGADALSMKTPRGPEAMTDDVKLTHLVRLIKAVSDLTRDTYVIEENDYVHIDEVKQFLWAIYKMIEDKYKRMMTGEIKQEELLNSVQVGLRNVVMPHVGRKKK